MPLTTNALLQILVLALGVYVVLGFIRTTRGSGLMRGLVVTVLLGVTSFYVVSTYFELSELDFILKISSGYAVIVLAVLFQPELRRGMVHLGENPLLGRLLMNRRQEVVTEVAQAIVKMAGKRQGALIAFERNITLDAFIEKAVKVDAEVNRLLLDSIFFNGSPLHDGAVIIRGDRVAGAGCLFPLTENVEISKSTGTRHRAALGLTEETDAVTVAVSEETGAISISQGGRIERRIPPSRLESALRSALGSGETDAGTGRGRRDSKKSGVLRHLALMFVSNAGRKLAALAIGGGIFMLAHTSLQQTRTFLLTVQIGDAVSGSRPTGGELIIVPSSLEFHVTEPEIGMQLEVEVTGARALLESLGGSLGGVLRSGTGKLEHGSSAFPLEDVQWGAGRFIEGLSVKWVTNPPPRLSIDRLEQERIPLTADHITKIGELALGYEANWDEVSINPPHALVTGPTSVMQKLRDETLVIALEPIRLSKDLVTDITQQLDLSAELRDQGLALVDDMEIVVVLPIRPTEFSFSPKPFDIHLVSLDGDIEKVHRWEALRKQASFKITARGIMPAGLEPGSGEYVERSQQILTYVRDNLLVYVDVSDINGEAVGPEAEVRWSWKTPWREVLAAEAGAEGGGADLQAQLDSEPKVRLEPKQQ